MRGRGFLIPGRRLATAATEGDWRGAAMVAYYALFLEGRAALGRWGSVIGRQANVHHFVRTRFDYATEKDLNRIADALDALGQLRAKASYEETLQPPITSSAAVKAVQRATDMIALLDAIEADPARRAAAITSLPP